MVLAFVEKPDQPVDLVAGFLAEPPYGLLTFGVDAGPVPNKADLQSFCDLITERLKRLYDVRGTARLD